jgi:hypothetical protein
VLALLGTAHFGRECSDMVLEALKNGYRYLDTAQQYRNAGSVGEAIKRWGGKREDVYILTKCASRGVMSTPFDFSHSIRILERPGAHSPGGFTDGTLCGDHICRGSAPLRTLTDEGQSERTVPSPRTSSRERCCKTSSSL